MTHVRQQIRDRVATVLAGVGPTIYKMRKYALDEERLPAICVATADETSALVTIGARTLRRDVSLVIDVVAQGLSTAIYETIDGYCADIEAAIAADFTLNGLVKSAILTGTETDVNVEGKKAIGSASMTYAVSYVTTIEDAETAQ